MVATRYFLHKRVALLAVLNINHLNKPSHTSSHYLVSLSNIYLQLIFPCPYLLHFVHISVPHRHLAFFPDLDLIFTIFPHRGFGHHLRSGFFIICLSLKNILYFLYVSTSTNRAMVLLSRTSEQWGHFMSSTFAFNICIKCHLPLPSDMLRNTHCKCCAVCLK